MKDFKVAIFWDCRYKTADFLPAKSRYIKLLFIQPLMYCNSSTISELNIQASVVNSSNKRLDSLGQNQI